MRIIHICLQMKVVFKLYLTHRENVTVRIYDKDYGYSCHGYDICLIMFWLQSFIYHNLQGETGRHYWCLWSWQGRCYRLQPYPLQTHWIANPLVHLAHCLLQDSYKIIYLWILHPATSFGKNARFYCSAEIQKTSSPPFTIIHWHLEICITLRENHPFQPISRYLYKEKVTTLLIKWHSSLW